MSEKKSRSTKIAVLGIFTAVTVVLQLLSYTVKIGTFNLSLVLIPIVVTACLYGVGYSTYLGAVFGVVTVIGCITGLDSGGYILFSASPLLTVLTCMLKSTVCGLACGAAANALKNSNGILRVVIPAVVAPVVNTGIFVIMMFAAFGDILNSWAGGTNVVLYVLTGLIGVNFLIELAVNAVLSPAVFRVIKAVARL